MPVPKKMRPAEDKYGGDSDHQSDGEGGVQPMMTKIKTVLKSEWWVCLFKGRVKALLLDLVSVVWSRM